MDFVLLAAQNNGSNQPPQALTTDGNSNLNVNIKAGAGAGGTSSNFGAAFPGAGTAAGFKDAGGNMAAGNLDAGGNLKVAGSFSSTPVKSNTCSTNPLNNIGTTSTQVLPSNANRTRMILQNLAAGGLVAFVLLGAGTASATNFTFSLPPGGSTKDGTSPIQYDEQWTGAVQVVFSGAGGLFNAQENT